MDAGKTGRFIAGLRRERGMTQAELAEKLHVTDKAVSKWERGAGLPDIATLEPLAAELGVTVSELLQGEAAESAAPEEDAPAPEAPGRAYRIFRWVCFGVFAAAYLLYAGLWVLTAFQAGDYSDGLTEAQIAALERKFCVRGLAESVAVIAFSAGLCGAFAFTRRLKRVLTEAGWMIGFTVLAGGAVVAVIRLFTSCDISDPLLFVFALLRRTLFWICVFGIIALIWRRTGKRRDA